MHVLFGLVVVGGLYCVVVPWHLLQLNHNIEHCNDYSIYYVCTNWHRYSFATIQDDSLSLHSKVLYIQVVFTKLYELTLNYIAL